MYKKISYMIVLITAIFFEQCYARPLKYSSNYYINIVKRDDTYTPISINTRIYPIYDQNGITFAFYINDDPETKHGQTRLLIFNNGRYIYSYSAYSESCFVHYNMLRCADDWKEKPYFDVKISDILARRDIVIGGYDSKAYGTTPLSAHIDR
jgi:hypothetical protein